MQRTLYYVSLAALVALLPALPARAQITLDEPEWRIGVDDVPWLTTNSTERGGAYNPATENVLVASAREGGGVPNIIIVDAATGIAEGSLNVDGIAGGTFVLSQIAVTEDGQIFATNFTNDAASSGDGAAGPAKVYYWPSEDQTTAPTEIYSGDPSGGADDANSRRFGEGLGVSGTGTDVEVYLSGDRNTQLATFTWDGQALSDPALVTVGSGSDAFDPFDGASDGIAAAPNNADALWVNGLDQPVSLISAADGSVLNRISGDVIDFSHDGLAVAEVVGRVLLAVGPGNLGTLDETFRVVDVTDPGAPRVLFVAEFEDAANDNPTRSGFVAFDQAGENLIVFSTNNALASYALPLGDLDAYAATLRGYNEVGPVTTPATGEATARLEDGTLTVTGSFEGLTSDLVELGGSSAHIHVGGPAENGPVVIPLTVSAGEDDRSGSFEAGDNTYDLSTYDGFPEGTNADAVMSALMNGNAYVNVHTETYEGGEIRGQLLPASNQPPAAQATITSPASGSSVTIEGADSQTFAVDWEDVPDPSGDPVVYVWQLATDDAFENVIYQTNTGTDSEFSTLYRVADSLLDVAGVARGAQGTLYHRANAQDGSLRTEGASASITLVRSSTALPIEEGTGLPERFALGGNYPNPFNPSTAVRFDLPRAAQVSLRVYDVLGREVLALPTRAFGAGAAQELQIDAASLPSGTYFYRVTAEMGAETEFRTGTMVLMK